MKRFFGVAFALLIVFSVMGQMKKGASSSKNAPDFAFPDKVELTAMRDLDAALKSGDGPAVVNALVRAGLAKTAVSTDSLPVVISQIDMVAGQSDDVAVKSMLKILQATIYTQIYQLDKYKIDRRPTVERMAGDDYRQWSRKQFLEHVTTLAGEAVADREALLSMPLDNYRAVIDFDRSSLVFYPTLYDFIAYRAIGCLEQFDGRYDGVFNPRLALTPMDRSLYPTHIPGGVSGDILEIYASLVENRDDSAPAIMARRNQLGYLLPRIFVSGFEAPVWARESSGGESASRDYKAYMNAYNECASSPYAVELLLAVATGNLSGAEKTELFGLLERFIADNPTYFNINGVKNLRNELAHKRVYMDVPTQGAKGKPMTVGVRVSNVSLVTLKVYDVTKKVADSRASYYKVTGQLPAPVSKCEVALNGDVPFSATKDVEITLPEYGLYIIVPEFKGQEKENRSFPVVACSDLSTGVYSGVGGAKAVTVDASAGVPREGVSMFFRPWSRAEANETLPGLTDAAGFIDTNKEKPGTIEPRLGKDRYALACNYYHINEASAGKELRGDIFTALNLYRLGDKLDFSLVAYESDRGENHLATGRSLLVGLRDANYREIDTLRVTTDKWGRAEGAFTLPADGLTGNFTITFGDGSRQAASRSVMVSDYKLPTFAVKVTDVSRPSVPGDGARISGEAMTFAGFPVEEAQVKVQLSVRTGNWYWATTSPAFYETEAKTDAKGNFTIEIPALAIAASPAPEGYFIADVAVTSPDGETREAKSGFNMGKPLTIALSVPSIYCVDAESSANEPDVAVLDYNGKNSSVELTYVIRRIHKPLYGGNTTYSDVANGVCKPGNISGLLSSLPSGKYAVRFSTSDSSLADDAFGEFVVYRSDDTDAPVNELLWLPLTRVTADVGGSVEIPYASAAENPHVLMVVSDKAGKIVETRWLAPDCGFSRVKVSLPAVDKGARVYFRIVSDLHSESQSVDIQPASSLDKISITTETFRDKVTPGDSETLTFKVRGMNGASPESAVILDMSNKAIDVLNPNPLNFVPAGFWGRGLNVDGLYFGMNDFYVSEAYWMLNAAVVAQPRFNFYGRNFLMEGMVVREHAYKLSASSVRVRGAAKTEEVLNTMKTTDMALEESAVEDAADAGGMGGEAPAETGGVEENGNSTSDVMYRQSEMPLAFFRPMLQTDADGNLEVTYTVPDANTTWVLRSLAYNKNLLTATGKNEIVASKPLMVSTNATRFLRTGDKVRLFASVMNATDSAVVAKSVCELLDYKDGKTVAAAESVDTIGAMGRKVVAIELEVPADMQGVIYRVRSSAGNYTDGEQTLIPILASVQDVVESNMFYIAPGQNRFSMPLKPVADGRAYLKYTGNPAWEVVSALPGLRENQINSSLEAAAAIFSAAVADGLMKDYPEIARTLRRWRDNPADSALVSQLEKNAELKSILLSSTPWVSDALGQTERMQRLVLLLDSRNTAGVIEKGISNLGKNSVSGGGWGWTPNYPETSQWCTEQILDILGDLNRLGWLPGDERLSRMIGDAVAYLDKEVVKDFNKYPKGDYSLYCYTRGKFPNVKQSTAASRVTKSMVQRIIANWKGHAVVVKAADAIILNDNGYNATARQILESLQQYATETPEKGMWWQQLENTWFRSLDKVGCTAIILDAFALVDPGNPAIDKIRQWLILEKSNTDWGNAIVTSQVISSILTSGRKWTVNAAGTAIRVGDTLVTPQREEYATGAFTEQITPLLSSPTTLTIDRQGDYPSFGAVVTMRRAPLDEIKAVGCRELSVEKRMSVFNGEVWVPADNFKVGDRVKVTIVLKADADMDYVVIQDFRAAALEPVEQLPEPVWSEGLCFYRENRDAQTNIFINRMPRGTYVLDYELFATQSGTFTSGAASVQSQYNPAIAAHSAGMLINVNVQ